MKNNNFKWIMIVLFSLLLNLAGCKSTTLTVEFGDDIVIDGDYTDWQGHLQSVENQSFLTGFLYDEDYLLICLVSTEHSINQQIMRHGLELWLDNTQDKTGKIGIRYPLGMITGGFMPQNREYTERQQKRDPSQFTMLFENSLKEIEIKLQDQNDFQSFFLSELAGTDLELKININEDALIYEMKIPLLQNEQYPFALSDTELNTLKMTILTPEINRETMGERKSGGPNGGPRGGGGGMRGGAGRGRSMREGTRPDMPEPIKCSIHLKLIPE